MRRPGRFVATLSLIAAALAGAGSPAQAATPRAAWDRRPLLAVACASDAACTAVGGVFAASRSGLRWALQPIPAPRSTLSLDFLAGVSCPSDQVCVAVGSARPPLSANVAYDYSPLVEVRRGARWTDRSPAPARTRNDFLLGVSCRSATRCVAVGQGVRSQLAMAWNGRSWHVTLDPPAPRGGEATLNGVSCTADGRCVAVGSIQPNPFVPPRPLIEIWDGHGWHVVPNVDPSPYAPAGLNGVSCAGGACTAAGGAATGPLIERSADAGATWSMQALAPSTGQALLNGVACQSATDCTAVGVVTPPPTPSVINPVEQPLVEASGSGGWATQSAPAPAGGGLLNGVACPSPADCVAAGQSGGGFLIEAWNGSAWSIPPSG